MRVLLTVGKLDRNAVLPSLSDHQIVCGPQQWDRDFAGLVLSRAAPSDDFDLGALVAALPSDQRPDCVACVVDGGMTAFPRNLGGVPCTRLLLVRDTRVAPDGLARVLAYAASERFDRVVMVENRDDADAFLSAGVRALHWYPGLLTPLRDRLVANIRQRERLACVACPSPDGARYSWNNQAQAALIRAGISPAAWPTHPDERLEFLGHSRFALVGGDHGALRPEWFEALGSGALVFSPKPSEGSGFDELWPSGLPFVWAESPDAIVDRLKYFQASRAEADALSAFAMEWFDRHLSQTARQQAFLAFIDGGSLPDFARDRASLGGSPHADAALQGESPALLGAGNLAKSHVSKETVSLADPESGSPNRLAQARTHLGAGNYSESLSALKSGQFTGEEEYEATLLRAEVAVEVGDSATWTNLGGRLRNESAGDPRLRALDVRFKLKRSLQRIRKLDAAWQAYQHGEAVSALTAIDALLSEKPDFLPALLLRPTVLARLGRFDEALVACRTALIHAPGTAELRFELGLLLGRVGPREEAVDAVRRAVDLAPHRKTWRLALEQAVVGVEVLPGPMRDLLITMPETNRRHGTGVLLQRFFPDSREFVTLRSCTNYQGVEEFGGNNLMLPAQELTLPELRTRLRRVLEPFRIRRILCVPFSPADVLHAGIVKSFTGAPLCTYVMDDQNVYAKKVPDAYAHALYASSSLRLTISPEMQAAYAAKFPFRFDLMPPIVVGTDMRRENQWSNRVRPATHAVLVGNVWSSGQLKQLARFVFEAGLKVDWFGRDVQADLERVGLHGQGFLPESKLADRLTSYPFVIVPSGALDGTEDNEWLTRLSLPSRMVFLLQTQTPMLVLGSEDTAASRFVRKLGLGVVVPYSAKHAQRAIRPLTEPEARARFLANARQCADAFLMADAGQWIWRSLAAGRALPAPFDRVYLDPSGPPSPEAEVPAAALHR